MKRVLGIVISLVVFLTLTACGDTSGAGEQKESSDTEAVYTEENQNTAPESTVFPEEPEVDMDTKILVVYFSCTGTTKVLAEYAAEFLGADLYEIVPKEPYTEADLAYYTNGRADKEQNDPDVRPAISGGVEDMSRYETIIIGYPKMEYGFNCALCA